MIDSSLVVITHGLTEYPAPAGYDDWGVKWEASDEKTGAGVATEHPIKGPQDIENFSFPDPDEPGLMNRAVRLIKEVDRSRTLVFGDNGWGLFERSWLLVGMDKLLMWMYDYPDAVHSLIAKIKNVKIRLSQRLIDEVGVDGIRYGDDWGGESALMMGPQLWRKFIKPHQKRLYEVCKEKGLYAMQHADGHIEEIIPDLVDMGLDILNPVQPECNDVAKIGEQYGDKLSFHGAIGSRILDRGTPENIDEEVKTRIEQLGASGGYIPAPAHAQSYPEKNIKAFREAVIKYGRIPEVWVNSGSAAVGDIQV